MSWCLRVYLMLLCFAQSFFTKLINIVLMCIQRLSNFIQTQFCVMLLKRATLPDRRDICCKIYIQQTRQTCLTFNPFHLSITFVSNKPFQGYFMQISCQNIFLILKQKHKLFLRKTKLRFSFIFRWSFAGNFSNINWD